MITLTNESKTMGINFPSSVLEITEQSLKDITSKINLPNNYCVVALCMTTNLFDLAISYGNDKVNPTVKVEALMAKISDEDAKKINVKIGNKLIVDRSSLERGNQVNVPFSISKANIARFFNTNPEMPKKIVTSLTEEDKAKFRAPVVVVSLKVLPICDIIANFNMRVNTIDPFAYIANAN